MTSIAISIMLDSPTLVAARPRKANLIETLDYIPGNTVRGLLARRYLSLGGSPGQDPFKRLFLQDRVRFANARGSGGDSLPLSARSCKYDGGFTRDGGHGVVDLLLRGEQEIRCRECAQAVDYFGGTWIPERYCLAPVHTHLITRTAIDPARDSARAGQLFLQRVLSAGQSFCACIEAPDDLEKELNDLVREPFGARIGRGSSRGQGWVTVCPVASRPSPLGAAAERCAAFAECFGRDVLAVTLLSDALFTDSYLRDRTAPELEDLARLGINKDHWEPYPTVAFANSRWVFGFDGEPINHARQPRLAVVAGSVFLFSACKGIKELAIPAGDGVGWIGDNNTEGYGKAVLWYPFHLELSPQSSEDLLLRQARTLYELGFGPQRISAAQMSAVADTIRTALTLEDARSKVSTFLRGQVERQITRAQRRNTPPMSWGWRINTPAGPRSLGDILIAWIEQQHHHGGVRLPADETPLQSLQRFWGYFHEFHRYEIEMREPMSIRYPGKEGDE